MPQFLLYALFGSVLIVLCSFLSAQADRYIDFCIATGLSIFALAGGLLLWPVTFLHPTTMDWSFYRADLALGLDPLRLCRWVSSAHWRLSVLTVAYNCIPLVLAVQYVAERSTLLLRACILGGLLALPFYSLFPAVGPAHALAGYPSAAIALTAVGDAPRNCMPSMHLAWALLLAWNATSLPFRLFGWVFVGLTVLATIGLGEHYYIDLIAAVPFSYLVQKLAYRWHRMKQCSRPAPCV